MWNILHTFKSQEVKAKQQVTLPTLSGITVKQYKVRKLPVLPTRHNLNDTWSSMPKRQRSSAMINVILLAIPYCKQPPFVQLDLLGHLSN